jgi:hypothetical protein
MIRMMMGWMTASTGLRASNANADGHHQCPTYIQTDAPPTISDFGENLTPVREEYAPAP